MRRETRAREALHDEEDAAGVTQASRLVDKDESSELLGKGPGQGPPLESSIQNSNMPRQARQEEAGMCPPSSSTSSGGDKRRRISRAGDATGDHQGRDEGGWADQQRVRISGSLGDKGLKLSSQSVSTQFIAQPPPPPPLPAPAPLSGLALAMRHRPPRPASATSSTGSSSSSLMFSSASSSSSSSSSSSASTAAAAASSTSSLGPSLLTPTALMAASRTSSAAASAAPSVVSGPSYGMPGHPRVPGSRGADEWPGPRGFQRPSGLPSLAHHHRQQHQQHQQHQQQQHQQQHQQHQQEGLQGFVQGASSASHEDRAHELLVHEQQQQQQQQQQHSQASEEQAFNDSEVDSIALQAVITRIGAQARAAENAAREGANLGGWQAADAQAEGIASLSTASKISVKDSFWFLDTLEEYHLAQLSTEDRTYLEGLNLRDKAKHRNAVLFADDEDFILRRKDERLRFDPEAFESSSCSDSRVFLVHRATLDVMLAYTSSLFHAPAKSCIWSSLMYRVAHYLERSGFTDVSISEHVRGVKHKEATLFVQGYHISRSNFTKLCRQLLQKETEALQLRHQLHRRGARG